MASVVDKMLCSAEPLCREARVSISWTKVGGMKLPVRLKFLIARKKSFIAAMSISVALGGGGVISVSDAWGGRCSNKDVMSAVMGKCGS